MTRPSDGSLIEPVVPAKPSRTCGIEAGRPFPLGVEIADGGVNFAVFSRHASGVRLDLFAQAEDATPVQSIQLDPERHRTGDVWHVWVKGIVPGQLYGYRIDGPYLPREGHRFNSNKLLIDPFAQALSCIDTWSFKPACGYIPGSPEQDLSFSSLDDAGAMPKCIVTGGPFPWRSKGPLRHPWSRTVIYEAHVRGLTIHASSGVSKPGTYRGLIEKIPYLIELGVTAVELMPIQEFNQHQVKGADLLSGKPLGNYWGYDPVTFMAPKASYSSSGGHGEQKSELQELVDALHLADIEIVLDVVFNHTAEGDQNGPTLSFRGIDNSVFYSLANDQRYYRNFAGTGNSINAAHPVVSEHILSALRYWVTEMHVDGFRFDLASVLGRDDQGNLLRNAPFLERIAEDPILRETKLIAEAWDAAGAYEVGSFSDRRWTEWNGRYRDDVRRFWRGDDGMRALFASRLCGSSDLYAHSGKGPECSVNFLACHDGFTLNDLVCFDRKHNEANGEGNRDGLEENFSHNYGIEGETTDPKIECIRIRQIKNLLLTLFLSRGVPMLLSGDECRRTQRGNNNAYCQDNALSWFNWGLLQRNSNIFEFVRSLISFRRLNPVLGREEFYQMKDVSWFEASGESPCWNDPHEKTLGCVITAPEGSLCLLFNAGLRPAEFTVPQAPDHHYWQMLFDTGREIPKGASQKSTPRSSAPQDKLVLMDRSSVVLIAVAD